MYEILNMVLATYSIHSSAWRHYSAEANHYSTQFGISDLGTRNAFFHGNGPSCRALPRLYNSTLYFLSKRTLSAALRVAGSSLVFTAILFFVASCSPEIQDSHPAQKRIESALLTNKYFAASEAEITEVRFYCICGPYTTCEGSSKTAAHKLGYNRPAHKYSVARERLRILFFRADEVVEIRLSYPRFRIAEESEEFCSTDMSVKIPFRP